MRARTNGFETLPDRARRLVRSEDAAPGPDELGGVLDQLGREL